MKALKLAAITVFHPLVAFNYMKKDRTKFNYLPILVIMALMIVSKIFAMYVTHYPLNNTNLRSANLLIECAVMVVPILSWVVASYMMTTILGGEVMFRECLMACSYSLVPYLVLSFPMTLITNVMDASQSGLYNTIMNFGLIFVLLLLFINLKEMNHYTMFQTMGVVALSLFTMLVLWAAIALVAALSMRFINFVTEVYTEVQYKILG